LKDFQALLQTAAVDKDSMEQLIVSHEHFILKCASAVTRRYITKSDNEWSVALSAFYEAVMKFNDTKGAFHRFSEMVIKRRLTDSFRYDSRFEQEIPVNPEMFSGDYDENEQPQLQQQINAKLTVSFENELQLEILAIQPQLSAYGFTLFDLAGVSPKAEKTKRACAKSVHFIVNSPESMASLYKTRQLPIKLIEKQTGIPRKILERHRKYIIAAVEILSGDFPGLAEYLHYIKKFEQSG